MAISREQLYEEVWAEPMLQVAARHEVSASYLARVCACLKVPRPTRGYWAKLKVGQRVPRPALPPVQPGDETAWAKGQAPNAYATRRPPRRGDDPKTVPDPGTSPRHGLVMSVRDYFEKGRLTDAGYLRPYKRLLVDIFVTSDTLTRALDLESDLFLHLEKRGHRVALGAPQQYLTRKGACELMTADAPTTIAQTASKRRMVTPLDRVNTVRLSASMQPDFKVAHYHLGASSLHRREG